MIYKFPSQIFNHKDDTEMNQGNPTLAIPLTLSAIKEVKQINELVFYVEYVQIVNNL